MQSHGHTYVGFVPYSDARRTLFEAIMETIVCLGMPSLVTTSGTGMGG